MRKILLLALGIFLFGMFVFLKLDIHQVSETISTHFTLRFYALLCILILLQPFLRAIRFYLLFNRFYAQHLRFSRSFLLSTASFFVALCTPNKSGDLVRGLFSADNRSEITFISINEYLMDIILVVAIPGLGLFLGMAEVFHEVVSGYVILGAFAAISCLVFIIFSRFRWMQKIFHRFSGMKNTFATGKEAGLAMMKRPFLVILGLVLTFFVYAVYFLAFYLVFRYMDAGIGFFHTMVAAGVGVFVGSLTFIPMGMGTRDISAYGMFVLFGVDAHTSAAAVLLIRSLSLVLLVSGGICYFIAVLSPQNSKGPEISLSGMGKKER